MSFDVFFQRFQDGHAAAGGGRLVREVLEPHVIRESSDGTFLEVVCGGGSADVYLGDDHMMVNRANGTEVWQLLVDGAVAAGWVILPVGCPTCITDDAQRQHLPEGLRQEVALVASGAELLVVMRDS